VRILSALLAAGVVAAPMIVAKVPVAGNTHPCAAAKGGAFVWVSEYASPYLLKIDPRTNRVLTKTKIGFGSCGLAYGAGWLWIEDTSSNTISRVSARSGRRVAAIKVNAQPYDAIFAYDAAWATSNGFGDVERIDPARNKVVKRVPLVGATGLVAAFGSVWAAGQDGVIRIDPTTNQVAATIPLGTPFLGDPDVVGGRRLGAQGSREHGRHRRPGDECRLGERQGRGRAVRRHRNRRRRMDPELEGPRHLAASPLKKDEGPPQKERPPDPVTSWDFVEALPAEKAAR
jgi:hypothetical protein